MRGLESGFFLKLNCFFSRLSCHGPALCGRRASHNPDDPIEIFFSQGGIHRQLQCVLGAFRGGAFRLEGCEDIQHVANVDVHDFDVNTRTDGAML